MLSCIFIISCASNKIRGCDGNAQTYELRVMSKARKVLVNLVLSCICWYVWCAQFFNFVNLCDFGSFLVTCVPILSPIYLDC